MMKQCRKICINCPAGCHLEICQRDNGEVVVEGNHCPRGVAYARQEMTDPRRVVTAVVFVQGGSRRCIPVKSTAPVPLHAIPDLLETLFATTIGHPVALGQVVISDYQGLGIDMVTTDSCP